MDYVSVETAKLKALPYTDKQIVNGVWLILIKGNQTVSVAISNNSEIERIKLNSAINVIRSL